MRPLVCNRDMKTQCQKLQPALFQSMMINNLMFKTNNWFTLKGIKIWTDFGFIQKIQSANDWNLLPTSCKRIFSLFPWQFFNRDIHRAKPWAHCWLLYQTTLCELNTFLEFDHSSCKLFCTNSKYVDPKINTPNLIKRTL